MLIRKRSGNLDVPSTSQESPSGAVGSSVLRKPPTARQASLHDSYVREGSEIGSVGSEGEPADWRLCSHFIGYE